VRNATEDERHLVAGRGDRGRGIHLETVAGPRSAEDLHVIRTAGRQQRTDQSGRGEGDVARAIASEQAHRDVARDQRKAHAGQARGHGVREHTDRLAGPGGRGRLGRHPTREQGQEE